MLARQGTRAVVKILDFGLAKATQEGPIDGGLTREGQMLGTPDYIAPEQSLNAQKADIRADIYSLGCTFYCLLTGRPPFTGKSLFQILQAHHSTDATPLNVARPEVPAELAALVAKMMAKEPSHRFQTPGEVAQAIKPFLRPGDTKLEASQAGRAVVSPGTAATPPKTATTAATLIEGPRAAHPGEVLELVDLGEATSRSAEKTAANPRGANGAPWLWPTVAGGALVLGLTLAWIFGLAPGPKGGYGEPPEPVGASRSNAEDRGAVKTPSDAARSGRNESAPRTAPEKRPELAAVGPVAAAPDVPPPPVVPKRNVRKTAPAITKTPRKPRRKEGPVVASKPAVEPVLDFRHLPIHTGVVRLANAGGGPPPGGIWPTLTANDTGSWQFGDPKLIEFNGRALVMSAGPNGNLLLTKHDDSRSGSLVLNIAATKGTEAYLALRAHRGPEGEWRAITVRLKDEGGKIRVGYPSLDFHPPQDGTKSEGFALERPISVRFEIQRDNVARVGLRQEKWELACKGPPASEYTGAIGLFVKSGTLLVSKMLVQQ
jgi:hypothetical protein